MKAERRRFPLAELIITALTGGLLVATLSSTAHRGEGTQDTARCLTNLRRIGQALNAYAQDNDGYYPYNRQAVSGGTVTWRRTIQPYVKDYDTWRCPSVLNYFPQNLQTVPPGDESNALPAYKSDRSKWIPVSYALSTGWFYTGSTVRARNVSEIQDPSHLMLVINSRMNYPDLGPWMISVRADLDGYSITSGNYGPFVSHEGRIPILLADGHAANVRLSQTVTPIDMWQTQGFTQTQIEALLPQAAPEYR